MKRRILLAVGMAVPVGLLAWALAGPGFGAAEEKEAGGAFARTTIDLGVVVSDVDRSADFYKNAIGFREVEGFSVPGDFCKDAGLTNGVPLKIRVLVLGEGDSATKLKLMTVKGVDSKKADNEYIHSQLGYSYLTIYINDTNATLARLKKAGVKPVAKGPVPLPEGLPKGVFLTVVRDPDGNLIELVGPKK
jgi:lactoylglutathione lyase